MSLKLNQMQIEKIVQLIEWFINEIKFCQSSVQAMVENCCNQKRFKSLEFLTQVKENMKKIPFPVAWENAVNSWQCCLNSDDKNLLKSLSQYIGAFDAQGQIAALKHTNSRFEESFQNSKTLYEKKGKLAKSLGILTSLAIYVFLI